LGRNVKFTVNFPAWKNSVPLSGLDAGYAKNTAERWQSPAYTVGAGYARNTAG
jgi:hypothetical protein